MIYLDTHIVVWLYAGQLKKLTDLAKEMINSNAITVSPIVRLELQYLYEIQRISEEANIIIADLSDRIGLQICDKYFNAVIGNAIHFSWTRDPFDRMIVANAALNNNALITKDQNILSNYRHAIW